jgi:hydroxyacylglutathione hydrolase
VPFYLIVSDDAPAGLDEAVRHLAFIGLDGAAGWFGSDAIAAWGKAGHSYASTATLTPTELAARQERGEVVVIDVRGEAEWKAGHIAGAQHIPLGYLTDRLDEVPSDRPVVLHCQGGGRSLIATSLLEARGVIESINLTGGFSAWEKTGLPVER